MNKEMIQAPADTFTELIRMGEQLVKTGFLPPAIRTGVQAAMIIQTGRELGLPAMTALGQIVVIQGKPTLSAQLMLALMIRGGIRCVWVEQSTSKAVIEVQRPGWGSAKFQFTIEEAKAAGLIKAGGGWDKYPAAMLRARAIGIAARAYAPDVLGGISYTPEELGANVTVDHQGDIITESVPADKLEIPALLQPRELPESIPAVPAPVTGEDPLKLQTGTPSLADQVLELADQLGTKDQYDEIIRKYSKIVKDGRPYQFGQKDLDRVCADRPNWVRATLVRMREAIDKQNAADHNHNHGEDGEDGEKLLF